MRELDRATRATQREFTRFAEVASRSGRRGGTSFITGFAEQAARTACCAAQRGAAASGGAEGCGGLRWEGWVVVCVRVYPPGADDDAQGFPGVGSDDGRDGEAAG